jgi:DNA polymerase III delta prime subunit
VQNTTKKGYFFFKKKIQFSRTCKALDKSQLEIVFENAVLARPDKKPTTEEQCSFMYGLSVPF